jgi:hypothetical protein
MNLSHLGSSRNLGRKDLIRYCRLHFLLLDAIVSEGVFIHETDVRRSFPSVIHCSTAVERPALRPDAFLAGS